MTSGFCFIVLKSIETTMLWCIGFLKNAGDLHAALQCVPFRLGFNVQEKNGHAQVFWVDRKNEAVAKCMV